jgi:signal transduction histidine kinase
MQKIINPMLDWNSLSQERLHLQRIGQRIPRISFVFIHLALGLFLVVFLVVDRFPINETEKFASRISLILGAIICLVCAWTYSILVGRRFKHVMVRWSQMEEAYRQQEYLNQLKDQFISHVGHELRTPLTELYGFLDLIEQNDTLDASMRATFLEYARDGCSQVITIVNSILDTMNAKRYIDDRDRQVITVDSLVSDVLATFSTSEAGRHTFVTEIDAQLQVLVNEQAMQQVLRHLILNASTYCPAGTTITLGAQRVKGPMLASPSRVYLCVSDSGPGIPIEEQPLLFQRFVRLQRDLNGSVRGIGLGLFVSKQLVEGMGGQIWVESSGVPGEGSRFCVSLPSAPGSTSSHPLSFFNMFGHRKNGIEKV